MVSKYRSKFTSPGGYYPFTQAVLHRGILGQLTLPVGEASKRFRFAILIVVSGSKESEIWSYLVKLAIVASDELREVGVDGIRGILEHPLARNLPEARIFTRIFVCIVEGKVGVVAGSILPDNIVLFW